MAAPVNQLNGNHQEALRLLERFGGADNAAEVQRLIGQINAAENQQGHQVVVLPTERELLETELTLNEFKKPPSFAERVFGAYWARKGEQCRALLVKKITELTSYQKFVANLQRRYFITLDISARTIVQERSQHAAVRVERDTAQREKGVLVNTVAELTEQNNQKDQDYENLRARFTQQAELLAQKEAALNATASERDHLRERIPFLEKQATHFQTSHEQLGKMHDELQSLNKETSAALRRDKKTIKKLASSLSEQTELSEKQKEKLETLIPENNQLQQATDRYRVQLADKESSISRLSCHRTAAITSVCVLIILGLFAGTFSKFPYHHEL